jgi:hypothetical protein
VPGGRRSGLAELLDVGVADRRIGILLEGVVTGREQPHPLGVREVFGQLGGSRRALRIVGGEQGRIDHPGSHRGCT